MDDCATKPRSKRRDTNDSKVERKRELDRLAQRATRERTKNRIAFLEQKLSSLESGDRHGEIASLTKVIDCLRNDNTRLQATMMKMRFSINEALGEMGGTSPTSLTGRFSDSPDQRESNLQLCGCPVNTLCACRSVHDQMQSPGYGAARQPSISSSDTEVTLEMRTGHSVSALQTQDGLVPMTGLEDFFDFSNMPMMGLYETPSPEYAQWNPAMPSPFEFHMSTPSTGPGIATDLDKWHVSNSAFINCMDSVKKQVASNTVLDLHVPFKAAIWGWDKVGAEASHPVWAALRQVDQKVFGTWTSKAQRIALMYVCQTLLQYRENPTKENLERVPAWFRPRPSQEKIQHPAVIDFLIWPGLRDRLVFEHEKYTRTGDFSAAFVSCFNFYWPYSDREIFAYNPAMGRYEVSKIFLEYAYNFKNWTMKPEFFRKFPEMQHDIGAFEEPVAFTKATWTG